MYTFILCSFSTFAQDTVTIIAVGDAEKEKDLISIPVISIKDANEIDSKKIATVAQIVRSDFSLYKHLFEVETSTSDKSRYSINWSATRIQDKWNLNLKFTDKQTGKTLIEEALPILLYNVRSFAHKVSEKLYFSITGKKSIFETKILFTSDRTARGKENIKEIYLMDFDGERKQRITYKKSLIISPAISPDNSKILYSAISSRWEKSKINKVRKVKNLNLYVFDLKTKKEQAVSTEAGINSGAVFSADGKDIYLTLSNQENADIFKMNLLTKAKQRITTNKLDDVDPHINSDGSLLTFLSGRSGRAMIYTLDPNGAEKDVKRISFVGRFNAAPRFSPDGKEIVFSSWVDNLFDLYKIGSDGRNLVRLTKNFGSNEEAWFSPDGEFIVFTSQRVISSKKAVQNIYIMNRDGEIVKQLTKNYGKCFTPRWSN